MNEGPTFAIWIRARNGVSSASMLSAGARPRADDENGMR